MTRPFTFWPKSNCHRLSSGDTGGGGGAGALGGSLAVQPAASIARALMWPGHGSCPPLIAMVALKLHSVLPTQACFTKLSVAFKSAWQPFASNPVAQLPLTDPNAANFTSSIVPDSHWSVPMVWAPQQGGSFSGGPHRAFWLWCSHSGIMNASFAGAQFIAFGVGVTPEDAVTLRTESAGKLSVIRIGGIIDGTSGPVELIGPP